MAYFVFGGPRVKSRGGYCLACEGAWVGGGGRSASGFVCVESVSVSSSGLRFGCLIIAWDIRLLPSVEVRPLPILCLA